MVLRTSLASALLTHAFQKSRINRKTNEVDSMETMIQTLGARSAAEGSRCPHACITQRAWGRSGGCLVVGTVSGHRILIICDSWGGMQTCLRQLPVTRSQAPRGRSGLFVTEENTTLSGLRTVSNGIPTGSRTPV